MKLEEVRRIRVEEAAGALWRQGGEGLNVAAVDEIIARKEAAAAWVKRRARAVNAVLLTLAGTLYVWGFQGHPSPGIWAFGGIFYGLLLWGGGRIAIGIRYPVPDDQDLAFARRLRGDLEQEAKGLGRLRARAARNETFALYLRTFSAETAAMTPGDVLSGRGAIYAVIPEDGRGHPLRGAEAWADAAASQLKDEWTLKRGIVESIAAVVPVVCLGNIKLQDQKRADLAALGVDDATVVTADWWQLFKELEAKAAFTFVVLDSLTEAISRELDHLMARGRPFIVVCSEAADQHLAACDDYRALLLHPAVRHVVITEDNLAPLHSVTGTIVPSS